MAKGILCTLILHFLYCDLFGQTSFLFFENSPENKIILDAKINGSKVYALEYTLFSDKSSDLLVLDLDGTLLERIAIDSSNFVAMRMLDFSNDSLILLGKLITDTCSSIICTASYNFGTNQFNVISSVPLCGKNVQNLRITNKLDDGKFVFGYWVNFDWTMFVLEMNSSYQLRSFLDTINPKYVSIDFSRKGYVLKDDGLCNFFDKDFNYRKQRHNQIVGVNHTAETHIPWGDNYILENFGGSLNYEDYGQHLRLVDSNLHDIKHLIIPSGNQDNSGEISPLFFGGIDYLQDSVIWLSGLFNIKGNDQSPTHFSVSKVDPDLNLLCNQYIGFDAFYRMYGITATQDGGAMIYGTKITDTYDSYILKVGPNCDLPTSMKDSPEPIVSLSVYPNPTINSLTFHVHGFDPASLRVEIFNAEGIILFTAKDLSYEIEIKDLPAGQYFYRILQRDEILGVGPWVKASE